MREDRSFPFWIFARKINNFSPELAIKTCELEHGARPVVPRVKFYTSTFLEKEYVNKFKVDPYMSKKLFQELVNCDFGQTISHKQVTKTRKLAAYMNSRSEAEQYNLLETYAAVLRKTNPNSTVKMMTEMEGEVRKFKRFYVCFDAVNKGRKKACKPFIGVDGCHIKSNYPGQLLSPVGTDGNKDKQKGLLDAVEDLVPGSEHRHCVRHFHNNFKKKNGRIVLKNLLWVAMRDTTMVWFNKHMDDMFEESENAVKWLTEHDHPSHWSRSHFLEHTKCDMLLNNVNKSWNSVILECKDKPILVMQGVVEARYDDKVKQ
ncbi:hypothetical protein M0R45_026346 [Rubus argutus]|uniref:Protein FAR1-RELATED SEQUENCE n=1 Tax=Rubus argutus TaxID=59490 RepID=A0AAW1WWS1_RUBAR